MPRRNEGASRKTRNPEQKHKPKPKEHTEAKYDPKIWLFLNIEIDIAPLKYLFWLEI